MWIRYGCVHTKFFLIAPLLVASTIAVYFFMELMKQIFDSTKVNEVRHGSRLQNHQVIVAQYIGAGNLMGQLSQDLLNRNDFSPSPGEGEDGKPVVIPPRESLRMQQQFKINSYNLLASDRIALNRSLPDVRKKKCLLKTYENLPTTSVIIVFHNEAWSVLLRTVWSVINRSPKNLLKEIILIDDASNRSFLGDSLDHYVLLLPVTTRVLRLKKRGGIIPSRLLGANNATGDTLTFLDAHCECTPGWLPPLLARIKENSSTVVCPVIDIISDDTFGYMKSFELHWGAFNWQLHFRWYLMNSKELLEHKADFTQPFPTPVMAGGLFSIERKYFFKSGSYDERMKIWGGDNLEMSFRIWQCGGRIEIIPCSHVGHLFRKSSPYTFPGGVGNVLNINLARAAAVWMDDWAEFFFKYFRIEPTLVESLNVSGRKMLRKNLHCKSFEWYLKNIWPDNFFPSSTRFFGKIGFVENNADLLKNYEHTLTTADASQNWTYIAKYLNANIMPLQNLFKGSSMLCLKQPSNQNALNIPYGQIQISECHDKAYMNEMFVVREDGHMMANEGICLDALEILRDGKNMSIVRMVNCADTLRQLWSYNLRTQQISQASSKYCLARSPIIKRYPASGSDSEFKALIELCSASKLQKWILLPFAWK